MSHAAVGRLIGHAIRFTGTVCRPCVGQTLLVVYTPVGTYSKVFFISRLQGTTNDEWCDYARSSLGLFGGVSDVK